MDFIIQLLRTVFYSLDSIVYSLIPNVYALLIQITRTSIFTQPEIHKFSLRVYELIGVFMLFKVTVSVVNYILNPDDFSDKEKGFTNIIKRIILSLVMLVLAPFVFQEAFNLQAVILEENTIMNLVFGTPPTPAEVEAGSSERSSNSSYVDMAGRKIQFTLMYAFAQPNYQEFSGSNFDLMNCENTYAKDDENNYDFRMSSITNDKSKFIYQLEPDCWGVYDPDTDAYVNDGTNGKLMQLFEENDAEAAYQNYAQGVAQQSFSLFFRKEVITAKSEDGRYFVNYRFGISTAVGVATLYMFLMFCIDIAVRSIQWGFLQMISPIPILSYCDPKSSKDGMFKKWLDKCKKVYLDLFIRLFALYFGIYIITLIGTFRDVVTGEEISMMDNWILSIFMILGVLMFVKKLPDFLKETLALDGSGMFKGYLNPFKKIEDEAVGGKLIGGTAKKAVGMAGGAVAGIGAGALTGRGILAGMKAGMAGGWKGDKFGKNWSNAYSAGKDRARQLAEMEADDVTRGDVMRDKLYNMNPFHSQSRAERDKGWSSKLDAINKTWDGVRGTVTAVDKEAKRLKAIEDGIKQGGVSAFNDDYKMIKNAAGEWEYELDASGNKQIIKSAAEKYQEAIDAATKAVDDRVQAIVDNHSLMDDGAGGTAGGNAAIANFTSQLKTMDTLIEQVNNEKITYVDGSGTTQTLHINTTDSTGKKLGVKAQAKGTLGEKNAWESSSTYKSQQAVEKYSGGKKNK